MTQELLLTVADALKSKKNFQEYMEANYPEEIKTEVGKYPNGRLAVKINELTQNVDSLLEIVTDELRGCPFPPVISWVVTSEKDKIMDTVNLINEHTNGGFGIFVYKAYLENDEMKFRKLAEPREIPVFIKPKRVINTNTDTKQLQLKYWENYFKVCDELQSEMQIDPKPRHYQYKSVGITGVQILQTINTVDKYVASEISIAKDKEIYNQLLKHKEEIEKEVGELVWDSKENNKSSKIRKIHFINISNEENHNEAAKEQIKMGEQLKEIVQEYLK